jgi:hypothetical protein
VRILFCAKTNSGMWRSNPFCLIRAVTPGLRYLYSGSSRSRQKGGRRTQSGSSPAALIHIKKTSQKPAYSASAPAVPLFMRMHSCAVRTAAFLFPRKCWKLSCACRKYMCARYLRMNDRIWRVPEGRYQLFHAKTRRGPRIADNSLCALAPLCEAICNNTYIDILSAS